MFSFVVQLMEAVVEDLGELRGRAKENDFVNTHGKVFHYLGWTYRPPSGGRVRISYTDDKMWFDPKGKWGYPYYSVTGEDLEQLLYRLVAILEKVVDQGGILREDEVAEQYAYADAVGGEIPVTGYRCLLCGEEFSEVGTFEGEYEESLWEHAEAEHGFSPYAHGDEHDSPVEGKIMRDLPSRRSNSRLINRSPRRTIGTLAFRLWERTNADTSYSRRMKGQQGSPVEDLMDFEGACEELGGSYMEPNEGIGVCESTDGSTSIVFHADAGYEDHVEIWEEVEEYGETEDKNRWTATGHRHNLRTIGNEFAFDDAAGNPGPPGPMRVEGATAYFNPKTGQFHAEKENTY